MADRAETEVETYRLGFRAELARAASMRSLDIVLGFERPCREVPVAG